MKKHHHIQFGHLVLSDHCTFALKKFAIICNNGALLLVNIFGFGLWYIRNSTPAEIKANFRKAENS